MKNIEANSYLVRLLGYVAGAAAALNYITGQIQKAALHPLSSYNSGYDLADASLAFGAILALIAAQCLKTMEGRLSQLEKSQLRLQDRKMEPADQHKQCS